MFLGLLTLITALSISAVAIYYSVAGLMTIFAAAAIPIMIMGGVLEVGKLVTAVWLHRYWKQATWWLKTYLTTAVLVLMFITSMGIFGYLSKAHIEQTASANEGLAQIERIVVDVERQEAIIDRAESRITDAQSQGANNDADIQEQINTEQQRIDSAYIRIQPAIDEQLAVVAKAESDLQDRLEPLVEQANTIETTLASLSAALADNQVRVAQGIVGAKQDGALGRNTSAKIQEYRETEEAKRSALLAQIDSIRTAPQTVVQDARAEISRLRNLAEQQIADSNTLVSRLRSQLGTQDTAAIDALVREQQQIITQANNTIDSLTEQRYDLETEYRKLEAEVGPIKYIAEFVYGDTADKNMLEEAVRWVIIVIIFVFDPLAVLLLIAAQYTFEFRKKELKDDGGESLRLERQAYEQARAQRIVDNVPPDFRPTARDPSPTDVDVGDVLSEDDTAHTDATDTTVEQNQVQFNEAEQGPVDDTREVEADVVTVPGRADDNGRDTSDRMALAEQGITTQELAAAYAPVEKKELDTKSSDELKREAEYELKEQDETFQLNKTSWKEANPNLTLKHYKNLYVQGKIDSLPWEQSAQDDNYIAQEGYQQNAEQSESTLFNKLSNK